MIFLHGAHFDYLLYLGNVYEIVGNYQNLLHKLVNGVHKKGGDKNENVSETYNCRNHDVELREQSLQHLKAVANYTIGNRFAVQPVQNGHLCRFR